MTVAGRKNPTTHRAFSPWKSLKRLPQPVPTLGAAPQEPVVSVNQYHLVSLKSWDPEVRYQLHPRTRFRAVDNEGVIVQVHKDRVIVVNETGLRLMEILRSDQQVSLEDLVAQLQAEFDAPAQQVAPDVSHYLLTLEQEGIIEQVP